MRTQWKYAYWSSVSFNFLAETRQDIDAGTRIIDAGLSPCSGTQSSTISLYYAVPGTYTNIYVFLSGFEASSSNSAVDIRISGAQQVGSGFSFNIGSRSGNTITTVWIGYLAYSAATSSIQFSGGAFENGNIQGTRSFQLNYQGQQNSSFFGLTGLSLNTNTPQQFSSNLASNNLNFIFTTGSLSYVSANYFLFGVPGQQGSGCNYCQGYPYTYGQSCVATCPQGTYVNNGICSSVPSNPCQGIPNSNYNGSYCVCNQGYVQSNGACVVQTPDYNPCSYIPNSNYNGQYCICNQGYSQQGSTCVPNAPMPPQPPTPNPNPPTNPCSFIPNAYFNGTACQCNQGYTQSGSVCVPSAASNPCSFIPNSNYNGYSCVCNTGYTQRGSACVIASSLPPPPSPTVPVIPKPTYPSGPPITCPQGTFTNNNGKC